MKKVLVATICPEQVTSYYTNSVVKSVLHFASSKNVCPLTYETFFATYLHDGRNAVVNHAKKIGATHIIWIDSDMFFPPNAFEDLLNHDLDFVGVNYSTRKEPHRFTAAIRILKHAENLNEHESIEYVSIHTTDSSQGLEKVDAIGFGLCVTATHLFDKIEKPWFEYEYIPFLDAHVGEDMYFCRKIENITDVYVDHDLSKRVKHVSSALIDYNFPNKTLSEKLYNDFSNRPEEEQVFLKNIGKA